MASAARPVQAALTSAATFSTGALQQRRESGGASILRGATRVTFWGAIAMLLTMGIGVLF